MARFDTFRRINVLIGVAMASPLLVFGAISIIAGDVVIGVLSLVVAALVIYFPQFVVDRLNAKRRRAIKRYTRLLRRRSD